MKRVINWILVLGAAAASFSAAAQNKNFVLVIDPGHGGDDAGAIHGRFLEKKLNLDVALSLGSLIAREVPGVDVLYTRTDDRRVDLAERGNFANRAGADLFLSIHTNAARSTSAAGTETFVMGMDKSDENLEVIKRENEVIKYEANYAETYAGFDPNSTEMSIIFGMLQYAQFESSLKFARLIQKNYGINIPLRDRGAKQAPFAVLWRPTMPRVLTEIGFISNDGDRNYIVSSKGQDAIVKALFTAFKDYKSSVDNGATMADSRPAAPVVSQTAPANMPPPSNVPVRAANPAVVVSHGSYSQPDSNPQQSAAPAQRGAASLSSATQERSANRVASDYEPTFYVQLAATRTRVTKPEQWGTYRGRVVEIMVDGWYKYQIGPYTRPQAEVALRETRSGKWPQAFIVNRP